MEIAIVGAGLAGLSAAVDLAEHGHHITVLEAADGPGGRVRTDNVDGHLLDRGFQILLDAYPEAVAMLDYDALHLRPFAPGSLVHIDGGFHRVGDPLREPTKLIETVRAPIGSLLDKTKILAFRRSVSRGSVDDVWTNPEMTALQRLQAAGFSATMIDRFMTPLFAGITLDPGLGGSSRVLEFVFRMLSAGDAVVPANGMGAISGQLASRLPDGALRLSTPVRAVNGHQVTLDDGEVVTADEVVVATGVTAAARLTSIPDRGWKGVTSVWFSAPEPPVKDPVLVLNGAGTEPINSLAVMSQVSSAYAPEGSSTIVVSSPTVRESLLEDMRSQLRDWFGASTDAWQELRVDRIERAQPIHPVGLGTRGPMKSDDGVWICGDHTTDPSINGAIASGRAVARRISDAAAA